MKALCWNGIRDLRVETVPDPKILNPKDAILKISSTAICGSDLHLYGGYMPGLQAGDILGHEFMGEVVEVGKEVTRLKVGDRVVVPFTIACGSCFFCDEELWSCCDNSNPNAALGAKMFGYTTSGLFGYTHLCGGYAGGQAQYVRVPFADVGPLKVPSHLTDDQVLFLSDIYPTGYMAAEMCNIQPGQTVAIWGCGPVGQFAVRSALMLGAGQVLAIDDSEERLKMARESGALTLNFKEVNVLDVLPEMTGGFGPDACIDAVGMEAHGYGVGAAYDTAKTKLGLMTDKVNVLRQCIYACRKGGTVSMIGVYGGVGDKIPLGAAFNKSLTFRMGQTHMLKYMKPLLEKIEQGAIDPSFVITHRAPLEDAPKMYAEFAKRGKVVKTVLDPFAVKSQATERVREELAPQASR
jgi:threonine dehydrogenase-like Zn-dependent dehydrogenase